MMSSSQQAIAVQDLSKTFGNFVALDKLNFSLNAGQCMGYLGPNGSGKSTTIKILTGLSRPTSGQAFIFGREVGRDTRRALLDVGAVVETPVFPPFLSPVEILAYYGKLRGMSQSEISERSQTVLDTVKLGEWARRKIGSFSKGMVQRVALASAMLHDPDLLILDEPTSGLDPRGRVEVREIIKSLVNSGKTILMSTHLLAEAQELCDIIGMLDKGRLLKIDTVQNISRAVEGGKVRIELLSAPTDAQISMIGGLDGVLGVERFGQNSTELVVDHDGGLEGRAQLFKKLGEAGLQVVAFRQAQSSLESYYLSMMPESVD